MKKTLFVLIAVAGIVTFLLRAFPFIIFNEKKKMPIGVKYIVDMLPAAIMSVLVVYCIKNDVFNIKNAIVSMDITKLRGLVSSLVAITSVVLIHLWKRKTLLSIAVGTAVYMIMIRL